MSEIISDDLAQMEIETIKKNTAAECYKNTELVIWHSEDVQDLIKLRTNILKKKPHWAERFMIGRHKDRTCLMYKRNRATAGLPLHHPSILGGTSKH